MKTSNPIYHAICFMVIIISSCKQAYTPPAINQNKNYLVVDGFINAGKDSTIITLTRTSNLNNVGPPLTENGAALTIEGSNGYTNQLSSFGNGKYGAVSLNLANNQNYRLRIVTTNGSTYVSDYVPVKSSPPIDSISWQRTDSGVYIYANTHDPTANTRYYRWDYVETWQFVSFYDSYAHYNATDSTEIINTVEIPHVCYPTDNSSNILIASSAKLATDIIYRAPLTIIPLNSEQISSKYSILVSQHALTMDAYNYWQTLQNSTEQTGTLFDQQPSEITGNIHCTTNPNEPVIGYIEAGVLAEARIFITNTQVAPWFFAQPCASEFHSLDSLTYYINLDLLVVDPIYTGPTLIGYSFSNNYCVDCTLRGYPDIEPSFWQ